MVAVRKRNKLKHTKLNGQDLHTVVLHIDKKFWHTNYNIDCSCNPPSKNMKFHDTIMTQNIPFYHLESVAILWRWENIVKRESIVELMLHQQRLSMYTFMDTCSRKVYTSHLLHMNGNAIDNLVRRKHIFLRPRRYLFTAYSNYKVWSRHAVGARKGHRWLFYHQQTVSLSNHATYKIHLCRKLIKRVNLLRAVCSIYICLLVLPKL